MTCHFISNSYKSHHKGKLTSTSYVDRRFINWLRLSLRTSIFNSLWLPTSGSQIRDKNVGNFSLLFDNPFKQTGSIVIGQLHLQAQGTSFDRNEIHGTGGTLVCGIVVGTADGQPLSLGILVEDTP